MPHPITKTRKSSASQHGIHETSLKNHEGVNPSPLAAHEQKHGSVPVARYMLVGADQGDQVELPEELHRVLVQVVESLQAGLAVTVAPQTMRLTTQQAADLLGISRPTLVSLVEAGAIPFERQSSHRKLLLSDVLEYREKRKAAQYDALGAMYDDEDESPEEMLHRLSEARRAVAARRAK